MRRSLTAHKYNDSWTKYSVKRPKMTAKQFHENKNQCAECKGTMFLAEKPMSQHQHYRTYGYQTKRVAWRVRCATRNCGEPYCVILKPEYWDSAGE